MPHLFTILALLLLSTTARAESASCDRAALARAEAAAVTAQRVQFDAMAPAQFRVARELVAAAVEQVRAARALCDVPAVASTADPFETVAVDADQDAAEFAALLDFAGVSETGRW